MTIRAVLFDLGQTLWHIPAPPPVENIRQETVRRIFGLLGSWGVEPEGELRFLGRDIRLAVGEADRAALGGDCVSPHYPTLVQELVTAKGLELTLEQSEQLWATWNLEGAFFGRRLFDGAVETLETLQQRGFRLGCVTTRSYSGPSFVEEVADHGLNAFFEVMSISCDVGYMKPHPKIFEHALDALAVRPEETVMVGDRLRVDVAGAQALGITSVWRRYPDTHEETDGVEPDFVVDELLEVLQLPCLRSDGREPTR